MSEEKFDWKKYYRHANSYKGKNDPEMLRTAIGRYYYSSFLQCRDYLLENDIYLDKKSEKVMHSKSGRIHRETRMTFNKHPQLGKNGEKIAKRLNILRKYRNMVDYDSSKPDDVKRAYNRCRLKAKRVFELLDELE